MKKIADFKRKMIVGAIVKSCLYYLKNGEYIIADRKGDRAVSIVKTNYFAIKTWSKTAGKFEDSWCPWPKKGEFFPISENTAEIRFEEGYGKLVYTFI